MKIVAFVKSLFAINKIPTLFLNTLTVNEKHYVLTRENLTQTIQIQLSQKHKTFLEFFCALLKCILNFKRLPKKMTLAADVFLEISALKNMLR